MNGSCLHEAQRERQHETEETCGADLGDPTTVKGQERDAGKEIEPSVEESENLLQKFR